VKGYDKGVEGQDGRIVKGNDEGIEGQDGIGRVGRGLTRW